MEKAFERQIKTIEDQGEKQIEALKAIETKPGNKLLISKEIYKKIFEDKMDKILKMSREINFNNLY